jgi:sugar-specific transcriptional regulator TrmB
MNATQRKALAKLAKSLQDAKDNGMPLPELKTLAEDIKSQVESMAEEEQDKYDNLSEGLQSSEKGEAFEEAISNLNDVADELDNVVTAEDGDEEEVGEWIDNAVESLGNV